MALYDLFIPQLVPGPSIVDATIPLPANSSFLIFDTTAKKPINIQIGSRLSYSGGVINTVFDNAYSSLSGIPSTFTPSAHNQAFSTITGTPTTLAGYGITDAVTTSDMSAAMATKQNVLSGTSSQYTRGDGVPDNFSNIPNSTIAIAQINGLQTVLNTIPAAQVNTDWNSVGGINQLLNKPTLATVATSGLYNDLTGKPSIPAGQVNSDWNAVSGLAQILNKPALATVATSGSYNDLSNKPQILSIGTPSSRSFSLATAYQATDTARPALFYITVRANSSISLGGNVPNVGQIVIGSTNAVASGTGSAVGGYDNTLGGTIVVGLNLSNQQAVTYTIALPIGWYLAVRQTTGSGLQIVSTFEQPL